ncbi:Proprotein convertase subtilisin/kexin type 5 [Acipenser ruthenus]|uniref:Proprotein convertase subtilisin/kexin type 5 n=1 Tax=Acipenser ruthenus TaxID=7906 RepID=A0A444UP87_ACIRT|nr:Proprotein convertase subtilisin/kexin type 5 [Acipenser ruthenus]
MFCCLPLQIGDLKDYYHFFHRRTIKRSTLSSRGTHNFISMEPETPVKAFANEGARHGTRCAGEVAASANNSHCTVGIAYNAKIGGVRMLDGDVTDMVEAKSLSLQPQHIDIYSASWGPDDDGKTVDGPASLARQAFENGIRLGRKGRGSIFVWASGNGGRSRDHCSCDGYTNSIYTISISSTAESGKKPWYLEECSSTLTTTYSSGESYDRKIITTDLRQRCTDSHTGTSASAPMAAGIIALALEANPFLTWRDVQHIIVRTSRAGHLSAPDWKTNAAGYKVSHLYGFGLMDAEAMVQEAERWKAVPTQHICVESADRQIRTIRPENVVRSVYKAPGCADNSNHHVIYLEHVVVRITITHHRRGDLSIYLTSPSGTKSQLLANRTCVSECPSGFFRDDKKRCKKCYSLCDTCVGSRSDQCTSCKPGYHLNEETYSCVSSCPESFYLDKGNLQGSKCLITCDAGTYYNAHRKECEICHKACAACAGTGAEACTKCAEDYYMEDWRCVLSCSAGYYLEKSSENGEKLSTCRKCDASCLTCTGSGEKNCTSCISGYNLESGVCVVGTICKDDKFGNNRYLFQGECEEACPQGYYPSAEQICQQCPDNCEACERANECLKCSSGYYPSDGECIKLNCEEGEVEDPEYEECMECEKGCKKCMLSDPRSCFSCKDGFYMFKTRCFEGCPEKTYNDDKAMECRECHKNCVSCDENQCYWCEEGWFFSENECVETCNSGFYGDEESQECQPCHQTCKTCAGPNFDDCESCPGDQELVKGKCGDLIKSCPIGSFWSAYRKCEKCDRFCKTCTAEQICTSCKTGRYLTAHQSCVTTCPEKTFASLENGKCEGCAEGCAECSKEKNNCQKCLVIPKHPLYLHEGKCLSKCPSGYFEDVETCTKCSPECKACKDDSTSCQACHQHYVLYQNRCMTTCPDEHFSEEGLCKRCTPGCKKCDEHGICSECNNHFFLHLEVCVDKCPVDFYEDTQSQTCSRCHSDCAECDGPDPDECVSCADSSAVLYGGQCFQECPDSTYHDMDTGDCQDCDRTCQTCKGSSSSDCITCIEGMVKNKQGHCVTHWDCPLSSYQDKRGACRHCHKSCHLCTGPTQHECLSCTESHYLLNNTCLDQCPDGYYKDEDGWRCVPCHSSCGTCSGQYECSGSCDTGYYFSASMEGCLRCDPSCKVCVGSERTDCVTCQRNHFFLRAQGRCYFSCPEGYYKNSDEHTCDRCHPTCKTCKEKGALKCESCHFGFDNLNGICVSKCLTGEYAVTEHFQNVHRNCRINKKECIVRSQFILKQMEYTDKPALFITSSILMVLALGGGVFFFLRSRSKAQPKEKSGYEKLANSSKPISSFDPKRASGGGSSYRQEHGIEYSDRVEKEEEEEEDEDEDIVYMGQDGTVYRKFKYGLLEDDDDEELEYDDESYSFR